MQKKLLFMLFISSLGIASHELPKAPSVHVTLDFKYDNAALTQIIAYEILMPCDITHATILYGMKLQGKTRSFSKTTYKLVHHSDAMAMIKGDVERVPNEVAIPEKEVPKEKAEEFEAAIKKCSLFAQYARLTDKAKSTWAYEGSDNPLLTSWNTKRVDTFYSGPHKNADSYRAAHAEQERFIMFGHLPGNRPRGESNNASSSQSYVSVSIDDHVTDRKKCVVEVQDCGHPQAYKLTLVLNRGKWIEQYYKIVPPQKKLKNQNEEHTFAAIKKANVPQSKKEQFAEILHQTALRHMYLCWYDGKNKLDHVIDRKLHKKPLEWLKDHLSFHCTHWAAQHNQARPMLMLHTSEYRRAIARTEATEYALYEKTKSSQDQEKYEKARYRVVSQSLQDAHVQGFLEIKLESWLKKIEEETARKKELALVKQRKLNSKIKALLATADKEKPAQYTTSKADH